MSNLVQHARRELELCGQFAEDPAYAQSILAAVAAFASYGHSGGSAAAGVMQLGELLRFEALSPLTSDPAEWHEAGEGLWQNLRDSRAMSNDGGKTWWFVESRHPGERCYNGGDLGVLERCQQCGGDGVLHRPDQMPAGVAPQESDR